MTHTRNGQGSPSGKSERERESECISCLCHPLRHSPMPNLNPHLPPLLLLLALQSPQVFKLFSCTQVSPIYVCVCVYSWVHVTPAVDPTCSFPSPHFAPVSMAAVKSCCRCVSADVMTLSPVHNPAISQLHSPPCSTHSATPSLLPPPFWPVQKKGKRVLSMMELSLDGLSRVMLALTCSMDCTRILFTIYI